MHLHHRPLRDGEKRCEGVCNRGLEWGRGEGRFLEDGGYFHQHSTTAQAPLPHGCWVRWWLWLLVVIGCRLVGLMNGDWVVVESHETVVTRVVVEIVVCSSLPRHTLSNHNHIIPYLLPTSSSYHTPPHHTSQEHSLSASFAVDLVVCVALGCDMFDCVYPTRTAVSSLFNFLKKAPRQFISSFLSHSFNFI